MAPTRRCASRNRARPPWSNDRWPRGDGARRESSRRPRCCSASPMRAGSRGSRSGGMRGPGGAPPRDAIARHRNRPSDRFSPSNGRGVSASAMSPWSRGFSTAARSWSSTPTGSTAAKFTRAPRCATSRRRTTGQKYRCGTRPENDTAREPTPPADSSTASTAYRRCKFPGRDRTPSTTAAYPGARGRNHGPLRAAVNGLLPNHGRFRPAAPLRTVKIFDRP